MKELRIVRRRPPQPLILIPVRDGEYDDDADIKQMSEKIQEFLFSISKGYSIPHSCALSGCKEKAMYNWLNPNHSLYKPKLTLLYKRAKAIFYSQQVDKLNASTDWRAAAFWLERHEPEYNIKETKVAIDETSMSMLKMDSNTIDTLSKAYDDRMKKAKAAEVPRNDIQNREAKAEG